MTIRQARLATKHGTPAQFRGAVEWAYRQLVITRDEADTAIAKYEAEWREAGRKPKGDKQ